MESHMDLIRPKKRTKNVYTKALPLWLPVLFGYRTKKEEIAAAFCTVSNPSTFFVSIQP